jgi:hypothetical protein
MRRNVETSTPSGVITVIGGCSAKALMVWYLANHVNNLEIPQLAVQICRKSHRLKSASQ